MASGRQQQLFSDDPAPWEWDDAGEQLVASVLLASGPADPLDYHVPDHLRARAQAGCRVRVPLGRGNRAALGYCVAVATRATARRLKDLRDVVDDRVLLSPAMLALSQWIAERYLCTWGQALETMLPAAVRQQAGTRQASVFSLSAAGRAALEQGNKLPPKQAQILRYLAGAVAGVTVADLITAVGCTQAPVTALRRKGLVDAGTVRVRSADHGRPDAQRESDHQLNADQQAAYDIILAALDARRHQTIVLHGITGSGKTEVYIRAIQEIVARGAQAIVLVPEISLTPQTQQRFCARFGQVAVLHSHMTDAERNWHWQRIAQSEVSVVVGARSAVFAPVPRLGLIVVDEEHEGSFKQDSAPRYHARDVALERARGEGVPVVLGSATPALESWQRAESGLYRLVEMPKRVLDRPLPDVRVVDLRSESDASARGALSRPLRQAMQQSLDDGGQVILLLNRRGYSTHLQCPACGEVVRCPHCDIALTHHRQRERALCHYCDYEIAAPTACAKCGSPGIRYRGLGTQRLEAEVRARFADVPVLRMDTDTMQAPGSHERALSAFRRGDVRILLGTQMIAKGLDFPDVTLVGVVNADTALHLPDFRAAERTFQLLVQVAGRTGRGPRGGRVLVQTFSPDHPAILAAVRHDYAAFAQRELPLRKMLLYPPYADMVRIVLRGPRENATFEFARAMAADLQRTLAIHAPDARILGPAPAPIGKLRGNYRFQLQLQGTDAAGLRAAIRAGSVGRKPPADIQWIADVDPLDML